MHAPRLQNHFKSQSICIQFQGCCFHPLCLVCICILSVNSVLDSMAHGHHCNCAEGGLHDRLAFGGPMVPTIKMPPVHKLSSIPAAESVTWRLTFTVLGFGRLTVQAFILLPAKVSVLPGEVVFSYFLYTSHLLWTGPLSSLL